MVVLYGRIVFIVAEKTFSYTVFTLCMTSFRTQIGSLIMSVNENIKSSLWLIPVVLNSTKITVTVYVFSKMLEISEL